MAPRGGKRSKVKGWSAASVRRHIRWLYSVDSQGLTGSGCGVTLTMRDTPPTHEEWARLVKNLTQRLRDTGMIRWHWVVEWQRRGTPHLHMAVYGPAGMDQNAVGAAVVVHWQDIAKQYGIGTRGQYITPIYDDLGWSKYLSKHASRGARHYQRQGMPSGWESSGRLWGKGGDWPIIPPIAGNLDREQFFKLRRLARAHSIAEQRSNALKYEAAGNLKAARSAWKSVAFLRRSLKNPDPNLSSVRGISHWGDQTTFLQMAESVGWSGELSELSAPPASVVSG